MYCSYTPVMKQPDFRRYAQTELIKEESVNQTDILVLVKVCAFEL